MKSRLIIICLLVCLPLASQAQADKFRQQYDEFKRRAMQQYNDFRNKANKDYAEFLKRAWEQYGAQPPVPKPKDETVPPVVIPKEDEEKPIDTKPVPIKDVITPPAPEPQPEPIEPIQEQPIEVPAVEFSFYGTNCKVRYNDNKRFSLSDCSNKKVSKAWKILSSDSCNNTIRDCLALRNDLKLGDWAYLNMLNSFAKKVLGDTNEATLLTAYIYCQSGYKMRLATAKEKLYLLYASKYSIYNVMYYEIGGEKFYPLNCKEETVYACDADFPKEKPLSLQMTSAQELAYSASNMRTLVSKRYPELSIKVQVNKNLVDFYNSYPVSEVDDNFMTRWAMYANTPMAKEVKGILYPALKKYIGGLSDEEAVERLLNWVQTAFVYEYDNKVWGYDRAFFAEETLYYPYCDCEDRSILLTRLVRDLLGLKCILIYYPGHLASAVCFNEQVNGDYILLDGKRFTVCDGTYIGAPVGKTMPEMDNKTATVILLE